jgi:MFS superfamily sulfate permease-like transporter
MAYKLKKEGHDDFSLLGSFSAPFPTPESPGISTERLHRLAASSAVIALVGYLESISIAKAFARTNGYEVDASQELVALGAVNVIGSFFQALPVTGSFSRTAVNSSCNVRTQVAGIISGLVVILSFEELSSSFQYIPKASMSALIIVAVGSIIEVKVCCNDDFIFRD